MRRSYRSTLIFARSVLPVLSALSVLSVLSLWVASPSQAGQDRLPLLDSPSTLEGRNSYRATGTDPGGPRPLVLWRWDGTRSIRLASTRSDSHGRFDFGEQALPSKDVYFHVSIRDERPEPIRLLPIKRRVPAPVVISGGLGVDEIVLAPAHPSGEIRVYDADSGRLILRKPVESRTRYRVTLDFVADLGQPWPAALLIEQILDDGRRSAGLYWPLD